MNTNRGFMDTSTNPNSLIELARAEKTAQLGRWERGSGKRGWTVREGMGVRGTRQEQGWQSLRPALWSTRAVTGEVIMEDHGG